MLPDATPSSRLWVWLCLGHASSNRFSQGEVTLQACFADMLAPCEADAGCHYPMLPLNDAQGGF